MAVQLKQFFFIAKQVTKEVKEYSDNQIVCRRTLLSKNFLFNDHSKYLITACRRCAPLAL